MPVSRSPQHKRQCDDATTTVQGRPYRGKVPRLFIRSVNPCREHNAPDVGRPLSPVWVELSMGRCYQIKKIIAVCLDGASGGVGRASGLLNEGTER